MAVQHTLTCCRTNGGKTAALHESASVTSNESDRNQVPVRIKGVKAYQHGGIDDGYQDNVVPMITQGVPIKRLKYTCFPGLRNTDLMSY